ncbi:MAG: DUF4411 family protein [Bacteroidetes bacterium]|nr:DUF4411 family protein [Bacteroidota bacterium]
MPDSTQKYVLDSSVLMQAHRVYYSFDIAPAFWNFLIESVKTDKIVSVDRVNDEILKGNDELADWTKNKFSFAFVETQYDSNILTNYSKLMKWANEQTQFTQAAKDEFARADNADAWTIAYASTHNCVLVTQEVLNNNIRRKIPIPNVCAAFNVKYIDTFTLLRELNFKFK